MSSVWWMPDEYDDWLQYIRDSHPNYPPNSERFGYMALYIALNQIGWRTVPTIFFTQEIMDECRRRGIDSGEYLIQKTGFPHA